MGRTIKSIAFRFGLPLLAFALIVLLDQASSKFLSLDLNLTLLIIALLIATAWYLGRNPGLFIALVFEAAIVLLSPMPYTSQALFATINRLALFTSLVLFVSSRRHAEAKLREQQELLRQSLAAEQAARRETELAGRFKDEFLATISHELRTPLSAILGWAMMLKNKSLAEKDTRKAIEVIERNAKAQGEMIGDLLDISQIVTEKLRIEKQSVEIAPLIANTVKSLRPSAETKDIELTLSIAENTGLITGDPERLRQIVWNLLSNALKFTPENGTVGIRAERRETHLEIIVKDSGTGIDAGFLPFVFDRFRQGDASTTRTFGGLGLGLSIVRRLVELHGGEVSVESEGIGKGASFTVRLPLAENA